MTHDDARALAGLQSTLAHLQREADRRAKGAHPGMMRLHDDETADLVALLPRELADGVSDRPEATPEPFVRRRSRSDPSCRDVGRTA